MATLHRTLSAFVLLALVLAGIGPSATATTCQDLTADATICVDPDDPTNPVNIAPDTPTTPSGPSSVGRNAAAWYSSSSSDVDGDSLSITFSWGDGTDTTVSTSSSSGTLSASHAWSGTGTHCVRAKATDADGDSSDWSACRYVSVSNSAPDQPSTPSGPSSGSTGTSYGFTTSTTDPNGDSVWYRYYWGDGSTTSTGYYASGSSVTRYHSWSSDGTYCVKVRAEDTYGASSPYSSCRYITVSTANSAPNTPAAPTGPTSGSTGTSYGYRASTTDPDGDNVYYTFSWGDGSTTGTGYYSSGTTTSYVYHSWSSDGTYCVRVKATDSNGASSPYSSCRYITISSANSAPSACFSTSVSGMEVTVDTGCSSDADGDALSYTVYWGDGSTSSGSVTTSDDTRTHEYAARGWGTASTAHIGAYAIQVVVSDGSATDSASTTRDVGPSDADLALYWAPILHQDTALDAKPSSIYYDEIVEFNFDGDWVGLNNWGNAGGGDHDAYVYYHVSETETDYYIGYAIFHARDFDSVWGGCCDEGEHENDMETVLVMVHKDGSEYGEFVATLTMAHDYINAYKQHFNDGSASYYLQYRPAAGGGNAFSGDIDFESDSYGKHVKLDIEHGGHGIYAHPKVVDESGNPDLPIWDDGTNDFRGGDGNIYKPRTWAETPGDGGSTRGNDRYVPYKLVPIDTMWGKRYDYGSTQPFDHYGAFNGDDGSNDAAHAPWAIYNKANGESREDTLWFEHPAIVFLDYFQNFPESPSIAYTYRSVPMAWESHHDYGESSVLMEWTRPGMSEGRVVMGDVLVDPGDTIEYWSGFHWVLLSSDSTTAWVAGDTIKLRTTTDWDGNTDYGFEVLRVEWR